MVYLELVAGVDEVAGAWAAEREDLDLGPLAQGPDDLGHQAD